MGRVTIMANPTPQKIHIYGAKMFIKRDRFLGKFKKGPPHIGEYEKKVHF